MLVLSWSTMQVSCEFGDLPDANETNFSAYERWAFGALPISAISSAGLVMVFVTAGTVLRMASAVELVGAPRASVSLQAPAALKRSSTQPGGVALVVWQTLQG